LSLELLTVSRFVQSGHPFRLPDIDEILPIITDYLTDIRTENQDLTTCQLYDIGMLPAPQGLELRFYFACPVQEDPQR